MQNVQQYSFIALISLVFLCGQLFAQFDSSQVRLIGKVYDAKAVGVPLKVMLINKSTQLGTYIASDGSFNTKFGKNDTLLIASNGYSTVELCYKDSAYQKVYQATIPIYILKYNLKPVTVFAERDLDEIRKDIESLGFDEKDFKVSGINAFESPITFLYQSLSRKQQKIREAYEYINEVKRRDLLKELFAKYVQYNIIELEEKDFDRFIDFCAISDDLLKQMSQYEFIIYIKERYRIFNIVHNDDYYYKK